MTLKETQDHIMDQEEVQQCQVHQNLHPSNQLDKMELETLEGVILHTILRF